MSSPEAKAVAKMSNAEFMQALNIAKQQVSGPGGGHESKRCSSIVATDGSWQIHAPRIVYPLPPPFRATQVSAELADFVQKQPSVLPELPDEPAPAFLEQQLGPAARWPRCKSQPQRTRHRSTTLQHYCSNVALRTPETIRNMTVERSNSPRGS